MVLRLGFRVQGCRGVWGAGVQEWRDAGVQGCRGPCWALPVVGWAGGGDGVGVERVVVRIERGRQTCYVCESDYTRNAPDILLQIRCNDLRQDGFRVQEREEEGGCRARRHPRRMWPSDLVCLGVKV